MYTADIQTWLNPNIEFLFDKNIYEFDIHDAGLSIIKELKLLPEGKIQELSKMEKQKSVISVGKLQRDDKEFSKSLLNGFEEMRKRFLINNQLSDNDIISVKKDAFFVTKKCKNTTFGFVEFVIKNKYTSYIRFSNNHNIECYYSDALLDIKGLSEVSENKHRLYLLDFLRKYFNMMENRNPRIKRFMINFINDYKNENLDEGYYLEFNNKSHSFDMYYNFINLITPLVQIIVKEGL